MPQCEGAEGLLVWWFNWAAYQWVMSLKSAPDWVTGELMISSCFISSSILLSVHYALLARSEHWVYGAVRLVPTRLGFILDDTCTISSLILDACSFQYGWYSGSIEAIPFLLFCLQILRLYFLQIEIKINCPDRLKKKNCQFSTSFITNPTAI